MIRLLFPAFVLAAPLAGQSIIFQDFIFACFTGSPRISVPPVPTATVGVPYRLQLGRCGSRSDILSYGFAIQSAPTGSPFSITTDGLISGTPSRTGSFALTVALLGEDGLPVIKGLPRGKEASAQPSGNGRSATVLLATASVTINVVDPPPPPTDCLGCLQISACPASAARLGQPYQAALSASGPSTQGAPAGPFVWGLSQGVLPGGLSLSAGGVIAGTPRSEGVASFTLAVSRSVGNAIQTGSRECSISVTRTAPPPPPEPSTPPVIVTDCPIPAAEVGIAYNFAFQAGGGMPPYRWSLSGALPEGLSLAPNGILSGMPVASGDFGFTISVSDSRERSVSKSCSIRSGLPAERFQADSLEPDTFVTGDRTRLLRVFGSGFQTAGTKVIWRVERRGEEDLEAVLDAQAVSSKELIVANIPPQLFAQPADVKISVRLPQQQGRPLIESAALTLRVVSPPAISTNCPLPDGAVTANYSQKLTATGGLPPYTYAVLLGRLPDGLAISGDEIRGRPLQGGNFEFSLYVADSRLNNTLKACSLRVPGPFRTHRQVVDFFMDSQGALPPPEELSVLSDTPGLPIRTAITADSGGPWLRTAGSAVAPGLLRLSVANPPSQPGVYRNTLLLQGADVPSSQVTVMLTVRPPRPLGLIVRPIALLFSAPRGSGPPPPQFLQAVTNGGNLRFRTSVQYVNGRDWLTVEPGDGAASSATPANVRVAVNPARLNPDLYSAFVIFTPEAGEPVRVGVNFAVTAGPDSIRLSQSGLFFDAQARGSSLTRRFQLLAAGDRGYSFEAAVETLSGGDWLRIRPAAGTVAPGAPAEVEVTVDPSNLDPDQYHGYVSVRSDGADNSPRLLSVFLNAAPSEQVAPLIDPASLLFVTAPGRPNPAPQTVTVRNVSRSPVTIDFVLEGDSRVFTASAREGRTVPPNGTRTIEVRANAAGNNGGVVRASLNIGSSGDSRVRVVDLILLVAISAPTSAEKQGGRYAGNCRPGQILVAPRTIPSGFVIPNGWPLAIEAVVRDDCAEPVLSPARVTATVQGATNSISLQSLGDGRWTGTLDLTQTAAGSLAVEVAAEDFVQNIRGGALITGSGGLNADAPKLAEEGIVSSASFQPGLRLAAGGLFSAVGFRLADGVQRAESAPLPDRLGATTVDLVGASGRLPLSLAADQASFSQVSGQLPYGLAPRIYQVRVRRGSRAALQDVAIATEQPSIFASDTGQGSIFVDGKLADAGNPAAPGDSILIQCEGLGPVTPPVEIGRAAPSELLSEVNGAVRLTIGGVEAQVTSATLRPGAVGVYQVLSTVPAGVPSGPAVPVVVSVNGIASPPATMAIR